LSKPTADLERQLENVRTRIELLRVRWLQTCLDECFPPVSHELELLEREFNDLAAMVRARP
jgi:hypothetical protein